MGIDLSDIYIEILTNLYKFGRSLTNNDELVKDCVQDVFLKLLEKKDLSSILNIKSYVMRAFKNTLLSELTKNKTEILTENRYTNLVDTSVEDKLIEEEGLQNLKFYLNKSFDLLTKRQKVAVYLFFYDQRSYDEISQRMNVSYQAAKDIIHRALLRLRKNFDRQAYLNP